MSFEFSDLFTFGKEIGRGAYGTVFIATIKKPYPPLQAGSLVAIKSISTSRITSQQEKEKLETEISLMSKLNHPNIVKLYGVEKTSSHYYLILEYCNGGDLYQFMKTLKRSPKEKTTSYISATTNYEIINYSNYFSTEESIRDFASQIASGLYYLHSHQIVHRDLKPHNILISRTKSNQNSSGRRLSSGFNDKSEKITLKIADFGFARFLRPSDLATTVCGSPVYMAPEIQFGNQYSSNVDMWSLGIILYELITGQTPFPRVKTQYELAMELKNKRSKFYTLPTSVKASPELRNLIERLLTINPNNRMTFSEFMNDPFISIGKNNRSTKSIKKINNDSVVSRPARSESSNSSSKSQTKNNDKFVIDEDFDFEIISNSSFDILESKPKNTTPTKTQDQSQNQNQTKNKKNSNQLQNQIRIQSADIFTNGSNFYYDDLTSLSYQDDSNFLIELTESFKENQKFSFLAPFPEVNFEQAEEYLADAYTSACTITTHFTECQNVSNSLLINTEILVIRFLFDFLVEERHLLQTMLKSNQSLPSNNRFQRSFSKDKCTSNIERDVYELIRLCIKEVNAIIAADDNSSSDYSDSEPALLPSSAPHPISAGNKKGSLNMNIIDGDKNNLNVNNHNSNGMNIGNLNSVKRGNVNNKIVNNADNLVGSNLAGKNESINNKLINGNLIDVESENLNSSNNGKINKSYSSNDRNGNNFTDMFPGANMSNNTNANKSINFKDVPRPKMTANASLNLNKRITINLNDIVSVPADRKGCSATKEKVCSCGMQFLFNKAVEYARDAAKLEIGKQFEFAALKYQRALYLLQPIAFLKNTSDEIATARDLFKKLEDRRVEMSQKGAK